MYQFQWAIVDRHTIQSYRLSTEDKKNHYTKSNINRTINIVIHVLISARFILQEKTFKQVNNPVREVTL